MKSIHKKNNIVNVTIKYKPKKLHALLKNLYTKELIFYSETNNQLMLLNWRLGEVEEHLKSLNYDDNLIIIPKINNESNIKYLFEIEKIELLISDYIKFIVDVDLFEKEIHILLNYETFDNIERFINYIKKY